MSLLTGDGCVAVVPTRDGEQPGRVLSHGGGGRTAMTAPREDGWPAHKGVDGGMREDGGATMVKAGRLLCCGVKTERAQGVGDWA